MISTVESAVAENRDITLSSEGHSSTSSENDRNTSGDLDDGYEHAYNTLLTNNRFEDEHVYLTPITTSNHEYATPSENATSECSYGSTEQDYSLDKTETHCCGSDCEEHNESKL